VHELGLCEDIVAAVERRADGRPVARFTVQVGRLHHVHPEAFEQSIEIAAAGGPAEGAVAELVLVPVRARCRACGAETAADELITSCGACGSMDVELTGGEELVLESVEYQGA
jgi:hydrogenase nickel incorporation protein HypA/HybF